VLTLITRRRDLAGVRALEVGTGSGVTARELARAVGTTGEVCSVDLSDERVVETDGYTFREVTDARLPFPDCSFDLAISNFAFEHVGDRAEQSLHLSEIRRVLRPDGFAYFAVPNRWWPVEPHYKLPLLSWLPHRVADTYVRLTRRADAFDIYARSRRTFLRMASAAGFKSEEISLEAFRVFSEVEPPSVPVRVLSATPDTVLRAGLPLIPTMIFIMRPAPRKSVPQP
jgi:ubiquinone/menaquinone biosynthesis C-methylase UbiE